MPPSLLPHVCTPRFAVAGILFVVSQLGFAQTPQVLIHDASNGRGYAAATDSSGALFVGGGSASETGSASFVVLKYDPLGTFQWFARPSGLGEYTASVAGDLATDAAGNVYAVGYGTKPLPFFQNEFGGVVTSFDTHGVQRWAQVFNGPENSRDSARAIAVDPQQGLYVIGETSGAFGRGDWITIKYSFAGVEQWRQVEAGVGNTDDQPVAVKVDSAGNVVVLGWVQPFDVSGPRDLRLVKRDPQGNVVWRVDYSATPQSDESPSGLAIDAQNNIYVTLDRATSTNPELPSVPVTIKYDANGQMLFLVEGAGRGGSAIALDGSGNFIVSGLAFDDAGSNLTPATSKFSSTGALLWSLPVHTLNLAVDDLDGSVYLTRGYAGFNAMKISAGGQIQWEYSVAEGNAANDALVDEATGDFIIAGTANLQGGRIIAARFPAANVPPPPLSLPAPPSALTAGVKKTTITLAWSDNSTNEAGFQVERSIGGGTFSMIAQVGPNVRTFVIEGLAKRQTYAFRVRAFNASGASTYSNTAAATVR